MSDFKRKSHVLLLGLSGSGKSLLVKRLLGLTSGSLLAEHFEFQTTPTVTTSTYPNIDWFRYQHSESQEGRNIHQ